ncbi:hypothetical protein Tco_0731040 [Tanacetum coccineum]
MTDDGDDDGVAPVVMWWRRGVAGDGGDEVMMLMVWRWCVVEMVMCGDCGGEDGAGCGGVVGGSGSGGEWMVVAEQARGGA